MLRQLFKLGVVLLLALSVSSAGFAQSGGFQPEPNQIVPVSSYNVPTTKSSPALSAPAQKTPQTLEPNTVNPQDFKLISVIVTFDSKFDVNSLKAATGGEVIHRYKKVFNGASLVIDGEKIDQLASLPGITGVYLDELQKPDTNVSPEFIGAPVLWQALGGQESAGEGITVGLLDTGVWPEHPSFSDPDPSGKPYAPPAVVPGANGFAGAPRSTCDFGNTAYNPDDAPFECNNKLIGAYEFMDTYKAVVGLLPKEFDSARDAEGHGTHTSSTAAGNGGVEASIYDIPRGVVSGIAPRAHIVMYRVCGDSGCYNSDSIAAVEQAILDHVDALNFSISGGANPFSDAVSLAFLSAYENGVFVAASAGNSGPTANTTDHREPWVTTVAASNTDRFFVSTVHLTADNGDVQELTGASVTPGIDVSTPVVFPPAGQELCLDPFPAGTFNGEIVICERGTNARVEKSYNVAVGGAGGMLEYNPSLQGLATDNFFVPGVLLEVDQGDLLLAFMASHTGVEATFTEGLATTVQGDVMAAFSSRGGPAQSLGVSKPDVTAPGVQILAGMTPDPATIVGGAPGQLFQAIQGTSMSSPHVAGSGALLKALHPDWTPGQIKSALMTTAFAEVFKEDGTTPADAFDDGSGRIDLTKAGNPGLTFDDTGPNYVALQDQLWNANYPSLYLPVMPGKFSVSRTVRSTLNKNSLWNLRVDSPPDVQISVPNNLQVKAMGTQTFDISIDASRVPLGEVRFATLYLEWGHVSLRFPITFVRSQPQVTLEKTCTPASIPLGMTTDCSISATNTSFDDVAVTVTDRLPQQLVMDQNSLVGATSTGAKKISFSGTLAGAQPPIVTVIDGAGTTPAGYLPLSLFGVAPISGMGDETIANYNLPSFVYAGLTYSRVGLVSDGYVVVGGGTGADVQYINQNLPDPTRPNNVLAPFWTDLNPGTGGAMRIAILSDSGLRWLVADWEAVPNYSGGDNSFQVWIGLNGTEDISFTYGPVTGGEGGALTVGAENAFGNSGQNYYYNGTGTPVAAGSEVRVVSVPGVPGETHTIQFTAFASALGAWTNCAEMQSPIFQGTSLACFSGEVVPAPGMGAASGTVNLDSQIFLPLVKH